MNATVTSLVTGSLLLCHAALFAVAHADDPPSKRSDSKTAPSFDPFSAPPAAQPPSSTTKRSPDPFGPTPAADQEPARSMLAVDVGSSAATQRIEQALARPLKDFSYLDMPLKDVMNDIGFSHNLPIVLDTKALQDVGIEPSTPITLELQGVSLRSGMRLLLRPLDLTFIIRDEVLQITSMEVAERHHRTRIYRVADLVGPDGDGAELVELVTMFVAPDSWQAMGGSGSAMYLEQTKSLAVRQTDKVLSEVDDLLSTISRIASRKSPLAQ